METCSICGKPCKIFLLQTKLMDICFDCGKDIIKTCLVEEITPNIPKQTVKPETNKPETKEEKNTRNYENGKIMKESRSNTGVIGVSFIKGLNKFMVSFNFKKSIATGKPVKLRRLMSDFDQAVRLRLVFEFNHQGRENASQKHLFVKYGI